MHTIKSLSLTAFAILISFCLAGCQLAVTDPLPPDEYLEEALTWLEANAVMAGNVDWEAVRMEANQIAAEAQTTADTYPAVEYALEQLNDPQAFMITPEMSAMQSTGLGITAVYPENIIIKVDENSPGAKAGLWAGDRLLAINGAPPTPEQFRPRQVDFLHEALDSKDVTLAWQRRDQKDHVEEQWQITLTEEGYVYENEPLGREFVIGEKTVGYLDLIIDQGTRLYPTRAQAAMADVDGPDTCGWMIDLRRNRGGDLWTYFAALSPFLGDGEPGGFVYQDGRRETWTLRDGKVYWADEEREESYVRGPRHRLQGSPSPPVAFLTGPLTEAAGELVVVAFQGWGNTRTFGEPTLGSPHLIQHGLLSDGVRLFVSGAEGMDRNGIVYNSPIIPDEAVPIDWQHLGDEQDPVIAAALEWLAAQETCKP
jgi:carboxyl-terminal processing protease